jgi:hypothetical protein
MVALIIGALGWNAGAAARSVVGNEDKGVTAGCRSRDRGMHALYDNPRLNATAIALATAELHSNAGRR